MGLKRRGRLAASARRPQRDLRIATRLDGVLRAAGMRETPAVLATRAAGWSSAAAAVGWLWMGPAAAVAGACVALAIVAGGIRSRIRARSRRIDEALPSMLDALAAAMRAGAPIGAALEELDAHPALAAPLAAVRAAGSVGASLADRLDVFAGAAGTERARLVASALIVGVESGGDLPRMLDVLAEASRDRVRIAREARAASAQARMSAWVVAALPLVFLFLTGAASREQTQMLLRTPVGWALLAAGGALEVAGIVWMRRLSR